MWESIRARLGGGARGYGIVLGIWSEAGEIFFEGPMTHGGLVATRVEASRRAGDSECGWWGVRESGRRIL